MRHGPIQRWYYCLATKYKLLNVDERVGPVAHDGDSAIAVVRNRVLTFYPWITHCVAALHPVNHVIPAIACKLIVLIVASQVGVVAARQTWREAGIGTYKCMVRWGQRTS